MGGVAAAASGMLPTQDPGTAHHKIDGLEPPQDKCTTMLSLLLNGP
jgi:hypothetical protein